MFPASFTETGISDKLDNVEDAFDELKEAVQNVTNDLPVAQRSKIPLFMAATAGMRLAFVSDSMKSFRMFDILRAALPSTGLKVTNPITRIRLLSGGDEGRYGWISVNNILGLINQDTQVAESATVGSLDLGGASTQIAFSPAQSSTPLTFSQKFDYTSLNLFGKDYNVYSHSFLCYGKTQFYNRLLTHMIDTSKNGELPCMFRGYAEDVNVGKLLNSSCVAGDYARKNLKDFSHVKSETVNVKGTSDHDACLKAVKEVFAQSYEGRGRPCSECYFDGSKKPSLRGQFRAYSGFSYIMKHLFKANETITTRSEMERLTKEICSLTWNKVKTTSNKKETLISRYCMDAVYILTLLTELGFDDDQKWQDITFGNKINDNKVSWAAGYMLDQTGLIPDARPTIRMPKSIYLGIFIPFLLLLLGSIIVVIWVGVKKLR